MKKIKKFIIMGIALVCIICAKNAVFAQNGDVIGKVYSTDIIAKIDGLNAPSYNIGGKTAIVIEELADINSSRSYAIQMKYDDTQRRLDVVMNSSRGYYGEEYDEIKRGTVGQIVGDVYETDIKVYFNGYEINGINIGGKTAVIIEELGLVGGINEEFGLSKYRAKATWNPDERIIALDFVTGKHFSEFDYGNFLKYEINDNVMTATFDRMTVCYSEVTGHNLSEEFAKEENVIKPLYFDNGTEKTEVGFMYIERNTVGDYTSNILYITEPELMTELTKDIHDGKTPTMQEAFDFLDDGVNYKTLDKMETEDFYVVTVELLQVEGEWNDIAYVLVKKTGGYGKIYSGSTYYKTRVIEKFEKKGENIIRIGEGPTADPHGRPAIMYCEFNLNNYFVK